MKGPDRGPRLRQTGLHPKNSAFQRVFAVFLENRSPGFDLTGNPYGEIRMGLLNAPVNPAGAELPQRLPDILTAGDKSVQRHDLLAGCVRRQKGKGEVVAPDRSAVARRQFISKRKRLNTIPLF